AWVTDGTGEAAFLAETLGGGITEIRAALDKLKGDLLATGHIFRFVDSTHAACTQLFEQAVTSYLIWSSGGLAILPAVNISVLLWGIDSCGFQRRASDGAEGGATSAAKPGGFSFVAELRLARGAPALHQGLRW
ncbi:MAG TPA: hypothetical protein PLX97_12855, partial [Gemmatales bacterium]|nr:hypothetical protein [Gemmatales bacterium]